VEIARRSEQTGGRPFVDFRVVVLKGGAMRPMVVIVCLLVALAGSRANAATPQDNRNIDEVWQTLRQAPEAGEAERAQIMRVLDHPLTRDVAGEYSLDLDAAVRSVQLLDGDELDQLAQRAAAIEPALAGGDRVVISTTVIIIVLLVVILLLVAD
jgi:hypothetical protein